MTLTHVIILFGCFIITLQQLPPASVLPPPGRTVVAGAVSRTEPGLPPYQAAFRTEYPPGIALTGQPARIAQPLITTLDQVLLQPVPAPPPPAAVVSAGYTPEIPLSIMMPDISGLVGNILDIVGRMTQPLLQLPDLIARMPWVSVPVIAPGTLSEFVIMHGPYCTCCSRGQCIEMVCPGGCQVSGGHCLCNA